MIVDREAPTTSGKKKKQGRGIDSDDDHISVEDADASNNIGDQSTMLLDQSKMYDSSHKLKGDSQLIHDPDRSMAKMKELSLEIKGQDKDQLEDEKKDLGQKNKSELRQRFRLDSVMSREEEMSAKSNDDSGSTDEYHVSSQESEHDELSEMMGNHVNIQIYNQMREVLTMHYENVQEGSANLLRRFGV